jgi:hypothetical protein
MDKRILAIGITMLALGGIFWIYLSNNVPAGKPEMTTDETTAFYQAEAINSSLQNISQLIAGLGFFITLISIGLRRRKGGAGKSITQRPAQA